MADIKTELEDDWTPGDVIYAEPDGLIILDDGLQTHNRVRARGFLLNRCPGCGKERPKDRPPGPPPVPGQWYCVNHRHLQKRKDYA